MPVILQGPTTFDVVAEKTRRKAFGVRGAGTFVREMLAGPLLEDDFLGDVVQDPWASTAGSDGAAVAAAINVQSSGVARLVTGAGADTAAANGVNLVSELQWKLNAGNTVFEARVKHNAVTSLVYFIGLTDTKSLENPMTLSGTTFTAVADDAVGFLFDTDATTDTIRCVGVAATVKGTPVDTSIVPVLAVYNKYRIEIDATGLALFYIDDALVGSIPVAATITVALTPVIYSQSHIGTLRNCDVDYIHLRQDRV